MNKIIGKPESKYEYEFIVVTETAEKDPVLSPVDKEVSQAEMPGYFCAAGRPRTLHFRGGLYFAVNRHFEQFLAAKFVQFAYCAIPKLML